jgi:hypothetical protein
MKYIIDNKLPKVGETLLQSGMTLRANDIEGPCDFVFSKLYIYPESSDHATLVNVGDDVEVLSEQRDMQELEKRKEAIVNRQLGWRDRMGEQTHSFDPSNESW